MTPTDTSERVGRRTLTQEVYEYLRSAIIQHRFPPGARLNEVDIAALLHISPTPVREALGKLRSVGLVTYQPYRGNSVVRFSTQDLYNIFEIRKSLEVLAVRQAFPYIVLSELEELKRMQDVAFAPDGTHEEQVARQACADRHFHSFFFERSRNSWLPQLMNQVNDAISVARHPVAVVNRGKRTHREHSLIVESLLDGNLPGAIAHMEHHIRRVMEDTIAYWSHRGDVSESAHLEDDGTTSDPLSQED